MFFANYYPSKIEWDLTNGPRSVSCDRAIRYSGLRVRSAGPVGDFLEFSCYFICLNWFCQISEDRDASWTKQVC